MSILRERETGRLRASLRAVGPAVITLALLVAARVLLATVLAPAGEPLSGVRAALARAGFAVVYVGLIWTALRLGARLDRRPVAAFGLDVDRAWLRDGAAGALLGLAGIALSLWWGQLRGLREVELATAATGGDGLLVLGLAVAAFAGFLLLGNVYEEVVYRGVMLRNLTEGLVARGLSPAWAAVPATLASLALFGLYHVPLRGSALVAVDAAIVGVTFALPYLLTRNLGLAVGVHFSRTAIELLHGWSFLGVDLPAMVAFSRTTLAANLEVKLVRIALVCLLVVAWVRLTRGELAVAAVSAGDPGRTGPE